MSANTKTLPEIQADLMTASSLVHVVGWAAVGQDYAGQSIDLNEKLTADDIQTVTVLVHDMLLNVSANLEAYERANTKAREVQP